jgi:7-cyano-7-deazaguanine synthase in queuosine biosynthesis
MATAVRLDLEPVRLPIDYKRMIPQDQWPSLFNPSFVPDGKTSRDDLANYDSPSQVESYGWIEGRNAMMLLHASIYAAYKGLSRLYWGLQQNLPELLSPTSESRGTDCNPAFMDVMNDLLFHSFSTPFRIEAPFLGLSKKHIIELGLRYNINLITDTYSCEYTPVCNACTQCLERNKLFGEMEIQ